MGKQLLKTLLPILMLLVLMPAAALADNESEYDLWVGGERVTSANTSGAGWSFSGDAGGGTLTLNNANITGSYQYAPQRAYNIYADGSFKLTVKLVGNSKIGDGSARGAILAPGELIITGGGKATFKGEHSAIASNSVIIENVTIEATGDSIIDIAYGITIRGSNVKAIATGAYCLSARHNSIEIVDSTVYAKANKYAINLAEDQNRVLISGNSAVTAEVSESAGVAALSGPVITLEDVIIDTPAEGVIGVFVPDEPHPGQTILLKDGITIAKKVVIKHPGTPEADVNVHGTLLAKMSAKGRKGLNLTWNRINGAEGYDVFFAKCKRNDSVDNCKIAMTIKGNNTFKWSKTGLKKGTAYKAYVKAFVMKDGKKAYAAASPMVHAYTANGNKSFTNAKAVKVKKKSVTLARGKTFKIKASVTKKKKSKKLMGKRHAPKLRYISDNSSIAAVSASGKITAKAKGSCSVYAIAHNGVKKAVKVTVK